jgi:hypothetical protein
VRPARFAPKQPWQRKLPWHRPESEELQRRRASAKQIGAPTGSQV